MKGGNGLRSDLGKNENHQRQQEGGNDDTGVAVKADGDDGRNGRRIDVDQIVTDQNQTDQPIRALQQAFCKARASVAGPGFMA